MEAVAEWAPILNRLESVSAPPPPRLPKSGMLVRGISRMLAAPGWALGPVGETGAELGSLVGRRPLLPPAPLVALARLEVLVGRAVPPLAPTNPPAECPVPLWPSALG